MAFYRLTKNTLTIVRRDPAGIKEAQADGFVLEGQSDADGNLISASVVVEVPAEDQAGIKEAPVKRGRPARDEEAQG